MSRTTKRVAAAGVAVLLVLGAIWRFAGSLHGTDASAAKAPGVPSSTAVKPALTVTTTTPFTAEWPEKLGANGTIAAWQEASVGAEVHGLRLVEVKVNVGDSVRRNQVLAVFSSETVMADVAQSAAMVAEAEAVLAEAKANADRARQVQTPGVISAQQISEYLSAERVAVAKLASARAQLSNQQTRLKQTQLVAPDDGVISSRTATVGAVMAVGQELFRLIRNNRLEWRAEVSSAELPLLKPGQQVAIVAPGGIQAQGVVRMVAPTVDVQTRMGLVYVDVASTPGLKAGMFAHGDFELGRKTVTALPQSAIVQREGFSYVYRVGEGHKVSQIKVETGRRLDHSVEITGGLEEGARVVLTGAAFLTDGDTVRVVEASGVPAGSGQ